MKNGLFLLALLATIAFASCEVEDIVIDDPETSEGTIIGRWVLSGFDDVIRYEFTEDKRYGIYVNDEGTFPTLEEFLEENPGIHGHDWAYEEETVVVDLNFGNYSRLIPEFNCDNEVINWIDEDHAFHSTYYREGHDLSACN